MPIIKSAKKRVKVAAKARSRNIRTKRSMREALKAFDKAVEGGKAADIQKAQQEAVSAIDIAAKKNVIHKNKAARQKSALSARAKTAGSKPAKATAAKKTLAKKPAAAKKPVAKKTAAKKPAAKKTAPKKA
ncbi:30S ribosomal protein S20 [Candidatus Saccharibacteria bacterium]|nr:30S ribosomal protein S20 [Candidatus Saccharibacteria bacterium]